MGQAFVTDSVSTATLRALNYVPELQAARSRSKSYRRLGAMLAEMGPAYGAVFVRIDCEREHGIELITQSDMFAAEPEGRIIRRDSMARPERHLVKRWQVLISGAGTLGETELYGRSIIADARLEGRYVGPHAMVLTFREPESDEALFTYAFLCSPTGVRAIRSTSFGTKILGLRKDLLADLPVPTVPGETQARIANLVRKCVKQRETYIRELRGARSMIEQLPEMREAHLMCAERRAHAVSWRGSLSTMSAWTFASTGGALEYLQRTWKARFCDMLKEGGVFNGPRFARVMCAEGRGLRFMSQRDAFLIRPVPRWIAHPGFSDRLLFAQAGTIMAGGHGTLGEGEIFGRAMLIYGQYAESAFTQDLLRILPLPGNEEIVYAYITTLVGMRLLRSTAVGTKILSMRLDLLNQLPFPEMDAATRSRVADAVRRSVAARLAADAAEAEAIRIIEEEVLPAWLA